MTHQCIIARRLRGLRDCRGATIVEAAFATPLLLLLTFGIIDFASIFYVNLALESGVSQAARFGITGAEVPGLTREDAIRERMRDATPTLTLGDEAFTFTHLAAGTAVWAAGAGGEGDVAKVSVTYEWTLMTPLIRPFFDGGRVVITAETAMMNERSFE